MHCAAKTCTGDWFIKEMKARCIYIAGRYTLPAICFDSHWWLKPNIVFCLQSIWWTTMAGRNQCHRRMQMWRKRGSWWRSCTRTHLCSAGGVMSCPRRSRRRQRSCFTDTATTPSSVTDCPWTERSLTPGPPGDYLKEQINHTWYSELLYSKSSKFGSSPYWI